MYIKRQTKQAAYTLVEMMVASGVFILAVGALGSMFLFTIRSFAGLSNYAVLNQKNRQSMDVITREIRQAKFVTSYTSNANSRTLTFLDGEDRSVTYTFDRLNRQLTLTCEGQTRTLLTNCNLLEFGLFMRPPTSNSSFNLYPVPTGSNWQQTVKVIQLTWQTGMSLGPDANANSEDIQTACVVMRKQRK